MINYHFNSVEALFLLPFISLKIFILDNFVDFKWSIPKCTSKVFRNASTKIHKIENGQSLETNYFLDFTMLYLCDISGHGLLCLNKGKNEGPVRYNWLSNLSINGLQVTLRWYLYFLKVPLSHYLCFFFCIILFCSLF